MKRISACPGWLDLSGDRRSFVFVPEKAQVVREIFELSIGGLGSYAIADRLNRKGVPPFGPSPTWDHTTIDGMLRSRATVGEYQPKSWAGGTKKGVPVGAPIANYYPGSSTRRPSRQLRSPASDIWQPGEVARATTSPTYSP